MDRKLVVRMEGGCKLHRHASSGEVRYYESKREVDVGCAQHYVNRGTCTPICIMLQITV
jgi:hypothetical protein